MLEALAGGINLLFLSRVTWTWWRNNKKKRITTRFQALLVPYYLARVNRSRSRQHGETQWQQDHWKAMAARRGAWKRGEGTIVIRWQDDEKYRNSRQAHGWTEEYCRFLDYLTTIDISYITPWHQRDQYECTITLVCNDEDRQAGPMKARKDFKPTTKILASLRQEQGRQFFQSKERENETKTIRWCIASRIRMDESKLEYLFLATFFLFNILTKLVPSRTSRLSMAWTHPMARSPMARSPTARSQVVERVNAADYLQKRCGRHFARFSRIRRFLFKGVSLTGNSDSLVSDGEGEDRTPRRTHMFLSLVSVPHLMALFTRTCVRVAQDKIGMSCIPARLLESSSHLTTCFTERSSTCLTHSHHFVPRHHRRHWFTADTNQENPLRHSASRCSFGHLAESSPHTETAHFSRGFRPTQFDAHASNNYTSCERAKLRCDMHGFLHCKIGFSVFAGGARLTEAGRSYRVRQRPCALEARSRHIGRMGSDRYSGVATLRIANLQKAVISLYHNSVSEDPLWNKRTFNTPTYTWKRRVFPPRNVRVVSKLLAQREWGGVTAGWSRTRRCAFASPSGQAQKGRKLEHWNLRESDQNCRKGFYLSLAGRVQARRSID